MWNLDRTKILTPTEVARVLPDLKRRARRAVNSRQNLIIFRLATCCGLRVSELIGLRIGDVRVGVEQPYILVRAEVAKRRKARRYAAHHALLAGHGAGRRRLDYIHPPAG